MKRFLCLLLLLLLPLTTALAEVLQPTVSLTELIETQEDQTILFSFVGDCTIGEQYTKRGYASSYTSVIGKLGMDYPFSAVADLFAEDDLTIANCEVVFTTRKPKKKAMALCADPSWAQVFTLGNVDVVNMYNNHTLDFGEAGRADTRAALEAAGIGYSDRGVPYITEIKGVKIAMISMCSAIRKDQMNEFRETLTDLRENQGVQFIILSAHWGKEDNYYVRGDQLRAEEFIDLGVDLIYGTGSHTLQPIEYYHGKIIMYSTCNFTFGANGSPKDKDTCVIQLKYDINEDGTLTASYLTALPFKQNKDRDFRPYEIEDQAAREKCLAKLYSAKVTGKQKVASNLPESFVTTGEVDLKAWQAELDAAAAEAAQ